MKKKEIHNINSFFKLQIDQIQNLKNEIKGDISFILQQHIETKELVEGTNINVKINFFNWNFVPRTGKVVPNNFL
jgi:ABC-type enterochelin transport system permease subunit